MSYDSGGMPRDYRPMPIEDDVSEEEQLIRNKTRIKRRLREHKAIEDRLFVSLDEWVGTDADKIESLKRILKGVSDVLFEIRSETNGEQKEASHIINRQVTVTLDATKDADILDDLGFPKT